MSRFEMSPEQVVEWRQKFKDLAAQHTQGEEVVAAAPFRQGAATASYVASKAQLGAIVYSAIKLLRKRQAGGLPEKLMLVVTPNKLYALDLGFRGRDYKVKGEAAVWDRAGLRIDAKKGSSGMTALTIASPAEGEEATVVGIGIKDDPLSQELIAVLQGAAPAAA
jgi:hypothetical protein